MIHKRYILLNFNLLLLFISSACAARAQAGIYVAEWQGDCRAAVSYTFDDGLLEHYTEVFPRFERLGIKGTFAIVGSKVGRDHKGTPCLTWEQLREMAAAGHEIANHGLNHRNVKALEGAELCREVHGNDSLIADSTGIWPKTFVYPGNGKTPEAVEYCEQGRVGSRTFQISVGSKRTTEWLNRWVDGLLAEGSWGVGMTHGITRGYDCFKDPDVLWRHLYYAASLRTTLWIATMADVLEYAACRDNVKLDIRRKRGKTIVRPRLALDKRIFGRRLTMVVPTAAAVRARQDGRWLDVSVRDGKKIFDFNPHGGKITVYEE